MELSEFNEVVVSRFSREITDLVFLLIQDERDLMQLYLDAVGEKGQGAVNRSLGKAIKTRYNLENLTTRESEPVSSLISSHQEF